MGTWSRRTIVRLITRAGNLESSTSLHYISVRASTFSTPAVNPGRTWTSRGLCWRCSSRSSRGRWSRLQQLFQQTQITGRGRALRLTDSKLAAAVGSDRFSEQIPDIPRPPVPDKMARVRAAHRSRKLDHNELPMTQAQKYFPLLL